MVSDSQKKATAKCIKEKYSAVSTRIRNDDMLKLKQVCLASGVQTGGAARMYLQALAAGDQDAIRLLRKLAYSDSNPDAD